MHRVSQYYTHNNLINLFLKIYYTTYHTLGRAAGVSSGTRPNDPIAAARGAPFGIAEEQLRLKRTIWLLSSIIITQRLEWPN